MQYSVIIPVYNSEQIIEKTVNRTINFFKSLNLSFEIILVNDASKDGSWNKIRDLAESHPNITSINFLKNYGQHTAVFCGIKEAQGDLLITLDDDLQNPPEEIIKLIDKINEGYDLVFGKFHAKRHGITRRLGSKVIGYLNTKVFLKPKEITLTNFRIFTKDVAERIRNYNTFHPYIPGLLLMFSSRVANVYTEHNARESGKSNYTLFTILKLVSRLLFNYSSYPLKMLATVGFVISFLSFMSGAFFIIREFVNGSKVPGWTTLVVMLSFINGFIIIMLGVLGEYVSRIMNQLSVSQAYQVRDIIKSKTK